MAENPSSGASAGRLRAAALSRTGRWLAVAPSGSVAGLLLDTRTGVQVRLQGHRDDLTALAFAPDERTVGRASVGGTIRLLEVADGRSRGLLPGHIESADGVAFSADGRTLVSTSVGVDIAFRHPATARELARIPYPEVGGWVRPSPDGERLMINLSARRQETSRDRRETWDGSAAETRANETAAKR